MNKYFYENESLDTKLCLLRFIKYLWVIIVSTLAVAFIFGTCYLLAHTVFNPTKEYRVTDEYYIDYGVDENGNELVYFNFATWQDLADTDYFIDYITSRLSFSTTRAELEACIDATLVSDTRIVTATVTSDAPDKTMEIRKYFVEAFLQFDKQYDEIAAISHIKTGDEASLVAFDNRTKSAAILGAMLGFIISAFLVYLWVVLDTSIYLPITLEKRTGIPTYDYSGDHIFEGTEGLYVENDSIVLWVRAGAHNGTRIDKLIVEAKRENKEINKAYLINMNQRLYKLYYATKIFTPKEDKK